VGEQEKRKKPPRCAPVSGKTPQIGWESLPGAFSSLSTIVMKTTVCTTGRDNWRWLRQVGPLLVPLCHSPGLLALPRWPTRPTMLAPMAIAHSTFDIRLRLWRFAFRDSASEFLAQQRRRPSDRSGDGSQRHTGRLQLSHFAHVNVRDWSAKLLSFAAGSSQTSFYALDD